MTDRTLHQIAPTTAALPNVVGTPTGAVEGPLAASPVWDKETWRRMTSEFLDHSYQQTWDYAQAAAKRIGAEAQFMALTAADGSVASAASVRIKEIPLLGRGVAYVPCGPLLRRRSGTPAGHDLPRRTIGALKREIVGKRGHVLRIRPPVALDHPPLAWPEAFQDEGFHTTERTASYETIILDLSKDEKDLVAGMRANWRGGLRRAEMISIDMRSGTDTDLLEQFSRLFRTFVGAKGFRVAIDTDFFTPLQDTVPQTERLWTAIASIEGRDIAGYVGSIVGDTAVYLFGASNEEGRKRNAGYRLQLWAIRNAKLQGARWYDLGGLDIVANSGVSKFKLGMGGRLTRAAGPYECVPDGMPGRLILAAETNYNRLRSMLAGVMATKGPLP